MERGCQQNDSLVRGFAADLGGRLGFERPALPEPALHQLTSAVGVLHRDCSCEAVTFSMGIAVGVLHRDCSCKAAAAAPADRRRAGARTAARRTGWSDPRASGRACAAPAAGGRKPLRARGCPARWLVCVASPFGLRPGRSECCGGAHSLSIWAASPWCLESSCPASHLARGAPSPSTQAAGGETVMLLTSPLHPC